MSVCDDVTFIGYDHTGAERTLYKGLILGRARPAPVTEKKLVKPILAPNANSRRCFYGNDRREHASYQRAPLPVQSLQRWDLRWIHARIRRQRILFRLSAGRQV